MDKKLHNLPPMKRFRLLHQQKHLPIEPKPKPTPKQTPQISPSRHLPAKKRKHHFESDENTLPLPPITSPTPYCLPAKKRIWAFRPSDISPVKSTLKQIDLNVEYAPSPEKTNQVDGDANDDKDEDEGEDGVLCAVCESTDGDPKDPIVFCEGCDLMVHSSCYGNPLIKSIPEGNWFCLQCSNNTKDDKQKQCCCLCPVVSGAMKPTNDGRWAHIVCAVFVPEVFFEDSEGRDGIDCYRVPGRRWNGVCYLCKGKNGCVVECSEPKCTMSFHVTCGLKEDLCIDLKEGKRSHGGIVAAFCLKHTEIWKRQRVTGKFKIVARNEE